MICGTPNSQPQHDHAEDVRQETRTFCKKVMGENFFFYYSSVAHFLNAHIFFSPKCGVVLLKIKWRDAVGALMRWRKIVAEKIARWCGGAKIKKVGHVALAQS